MRPRAVVVAHRDVMVAEGIGAALSRFPGLVSIATATSAAEAERRAEVADAVALDAQLQYADEVATRLRRRGVRVVLVGDPAVDDEGVRVSTREPVAALARALAPDAPPPPGPHPTLTARQREILELVSRGMAGKQVARLLGISPKTVERHKTQIFAKLGVPNQTAAVSVALAASQERM